jgi:hypothetical protein
MASRTPGRNAQGRSRSAKPRTGPKRKSRGSNPWDRPNPRSRSDRTRLTDQEKDRARSRAKRAGRPYPNLVDNMAVAREKNTRKP